jgi:putative ABC transport system permease protein
MTTLPSRGAVRAAAHETHATPGSSAGRGAEPARGPILAEVGQRLRSLRRSPGFSVPVAVSLVLGTACGGAALALAWSGSGRQPIAASAGEPWATGWTDEARPAALGAAEGIDALLRVTEAAGLLLVLALVVNIALLVVARTAARERELAVRVALGAPPKRLALHLLSDSLPFGAFCVALGILMAGAAIAVLASTWPEALPAWLAAPAVLYGISAAALLPLAFIAATALPPVRRLYRRELDGALQPSLRSGTHATPNPHEGVFREWLGNLSISVSVALLIGAGSLLHGFLAPSTAGHQTATVDARDTLTLHVQLAESAGSLEDLQLALVQRLGAVDGVLGTSLSTPGAWFGTGLEDRVRAYCGWCGRGEFWMPMQQGPAQHHAVGPGFFSLHGVPLVAGREFEREDGPAAERVAVIGRSFAYRYFPSTGALGKPVRIGGEAGELYTVIGVVEDFAATAIGRGSDAVPAVYLSTLQLPPSTLAVGVRTAGDPLELADAVLAAIHAGGHRTVAGEVITLAARLQREAQPLRWFGWAFVALGSVVLVLAALAVYATLSQSVARRTREMGIRLALGAFPREIARLVARQTAGMAASGLWLGTLAGIAVSRLLQVHFLGVRAVDPLVIAVVAALVVLVTTIATVPPARLAARAQPLDVLKAG